MLRDLCSMLCSKKTLPTGLQSWLSALCVLMSLPGLYLLPSAKTDQGYLWDDVPQLLAVSSCWTFTLTLEGCVSEDHHNRARDTWSLLCTGLASFPAAGPRVGSRKCPGRSRTKLRGQGAMHSSDTQIPSCSGCHEISGLRWAMVRNSLPSVLGFAGHWTISGLLICLAGLPW